jgi:hypothetical protein
MRSIATGCAAALLATVALAQVPGPPPAEAPIPRYEVEVIVFANRAFDPTEERFRQTLDDFGDAATATLRDAPVFDDTRFPAPQSQIPQVPPVAPQVAPPQPLDPLAAARAEALSVRVLRPEELKLGNEYRRLQAVSAYVPLVHAGWVQPGLPEADAEPFDLGALGVLNPRGTIRVHLGRFLHITLDLTYETDGASSPAVTVGDGLDEVSLSPRYRLTATRSARSGELHYFDHPAFGVLVRITPVPEQNNQGTRRPAA